MAEVSQTFYVSRSLCSAMQVEAIVAKSRANNSRAGLSGAMIFTGSHFAQVLEGGADAVDDALARIALDPRHEAMTILIDRGAREREFPAWTMKFESMLGADSLIAPLVGEPPRDAARVSHLFSTLFGRGAQPQPGEAQ